MSAKVYNAFEMTKGLRGISALSHRASYVSRFRPICVAFPPHMRRIPVSLQNAHRCCNFVDLR